MNQLMDLITAAYSKQKGYEDEWVMKGKEGTSTLSYRRLIDFPRDRFEMINEGQPLLLSGSDGKTDFAILYPAKVYFEEPVERPDPKKYKRAEAEDQTFKFAVSSEGMELSSNPPMHIVSVQSAKVGGKPVRRVIAQAVNPKTHGRLEATLLFWPDAWIATEVTIQVSHNGKPAELVAHATAKIQTHQRFPASSFTLAPADVKDFTKIKRADLFKLFGG